MGNVILLAKYHVKPGSMTAVLDQLRRMAPLVARHEPGCLAYRANRSTDDPNLLLLYEAYADQAALEAHRATAHFAEIIEGRVVPLLENREREFYEPLELT